MRLSTKGRYGVRLMIDLSACKNGNPGVLKNIAERQGVSEKYLWKMIPPLKSAGLIKSLRGTKGGYVLSKPPAEISLKELLSVLEGPLSLAECVDTPSVCKRSDFCVTRDIWKEMSEKIYQMFDSVKLKDMATKYESKLSDPLNSSMPK